MVGSSIPWWWVIDPSELNLLPMTGCKSVGFWSTLGLASYGVFSSGSTQAVMFAVLFSFLPSVWRLGSKRKHAYSAASKISLICSVQRYLIPNFLVVRFFFDFSLTYVGAGMICSHLVNISTLLGAILSWGILWPLISKQKGEWYPENIPASSMKSLYGYKVTVLWSYHASNSSFLGYYI